MPSKTARTILVVGATGATGKHVVAQLLQSDAKPTVKVIVRSAEKMRQSLSEINVSEISRLVIMEAALLDLSDEEMRQQTSDVDVVISCLGHTMNWKGIYGHPRQLVTDAVRRLTDSLLKNEKKDAKFILMGSDGVAYQGNDDVRPFMERLIISLIRYLIPPHRDNEGAAAYLLSHRELEWVIVRPTDLVDESPTPTYQLYPKPQGSLFGSGTATRSHVAKAMVELATSASLWEQWKFKMPVLVDDKAETKKVK
uniref:NAD(P)-binding domain-containing protein n=1 Tax=Amphora coffeiformis TaxID=265554 RepID=A0A7S3L3P7_9STRA|mmetsp:Transcript_5520/g.10733  ORF Transcript_5520/g.10733 Transcript_5520/m.10733 type:complete len:254 (+) Transcript_5520:69-830(+)|eukprot:scaffold3077_cov162-Amphora_coffeaeformis.AAC.39